MLKVLQRILMQKDNSTNHVNKLMLFVVIIIPSYIYTLKRILNFKLNIRYFL